MSDFLSECWTQLRNQSRVSTFQNRIFFGGALSGRDINAVNKTVSGLLKLLILEASLSSQMRPVGLFALLLESSAGSKNTSGSVQPEFRNTHFSYVLGEDGVEKSYPHRNCRVKNSIGSDPLE